MSHGQSTYGQPFEAVPVQTVHQRIYGRGQVDSPRGDYALYGRLEEIRMQRMWQKVKKKLFCSKLFFFSNCNFTDL